MPRKKTHKSVVKRMRLTRTGKVLYRRTSKGHLLAPKTRKRRRRLSRPAALEGRLRRNLRLLLTS